MRSVRLLAFAALLAAVCCISADVAAQPKQQGKIRVLLTMFNRGPTISGQAKENLLEFVKKGKGFYVQHLASASFSEWDEFGKLCGRNGVMGTSGHGPRAVFGTKVVNK